MATAPDKSPDRIAGMFDAIAPRYDLLNHLLSAGIDRRWRAAAIESLKLSGDETLVDVCCGTADVALQARTPARARRRGSSVPPVPAARVVGIDFSSAMLVLGHKKVTAAGETHRIALIRADAMRLPYSTRSRGTNRVTYSPRFRKRQFPKSHMPASC